MPIRPHRFHWDLQIKPGKFTHESIMWQIQIVSFYYRRIQSQAVTEEGFALYKIAFMWYCPLGALFMWTSGIIISHLTGGQDLKQLDLNLLSPGIKYLLPAKYRHTQLQMDEIKPLSYVNRRDGAAWADWKVIITLLEKMSCLFLLCTFFKHFTLKIHFSRWFKSVHKAFFFVGNLFRPLQDDVLVQWQMVCAMLCWCRSFDWTIPIFVHFSQVFECGFVHSLVSTGILLHFTRK